MASSNEVVVKVHIDTRELDAFVRQWHRATADGLTELDSPRLESPQAEQISHLGNYLLDHFPDEISEGTAVDTAIKLLDSLKRTIDDIRYFQAELEASRRLVGEWRAKATEYKSLLAMANDRQDHAGESPLNEQAERSITIPIYVGGRRLQDLVLNLSHYTKSY